MDRGAWQATDYRVTKNQQKQLSTHVYTYTYTNTLTADSDYCIAETNKAL